jgi:hypothetical protein
LRDFEEGFLHVRTKLTEMCNTHEGLSIPLVAMLHSVENILEMVEVSAMILRGDLGEANQRLEDDPVTFKDPDQEA